MCPEPFAACAAEARRDCGPTMSNAECASIFEQPMSTEQRKRATRAEVTGGTGARVKTSPSLVASSPACSSQHANVSSLSCNRSSHAVTLRVTWQLADRARTSRSSATAPMLGQDTMSTLRRTHRCPRIRVELCLNRALGCRAAVCLVLACGCADSQLEVKYAPESVPRSMTVSVLGVARDGVFQQVESEILASGLSRVLHTPACPAGYGPALQTLNPETWSALMAFTRADGITEDLLRAVAPAALGDHILVLEVYGRVPPNAAETRAVDRVFFAHMPTAMPGNPRPHANAATTPDLELSASLFSVREERAEAALNLAYSGSSIADALEEFARKLGSRLPTSSCTGWTWESVHVVYEHDLVGLQLRRFALKPAEPR